METIKVKIGYKLTTDEVTAILGRTPEGIFYYNRGGRTTGSWYIVDLKRKSTKPKASDIFVQQLRLRELRDNEITADETQVLVVDEANRYFRIELGDDDENLYPSIGGDVLFQSPRLLEVTKAIVENITKDGVFKLKERAYFAMIKNRAKEKHFLHHTYLQVIDDVERFIWSSTLSFMKAYNLQKLERLAKGEKCILY